MSDPLEGIAELDLERGRRRGGYPEAVFCQGKSPDQVAAIAERFGQRARDEQNREPVLFTRAGADHAAAVLGALPDARHEEEAGLLVWPPEPPETRGELVVVACAGTSDLPVARETDEARFARNRQRFLTEQGYTYAAPGASWWRRGWTVRCPAWWPAWWARR